jgi:hypothetical protein
VDIRHGNDFRGICWGSAMDTAKDCDCLLAAFGWVEERAHERSHDQFANNIRPRIGHHHPTHGSGNGWN